VTRLPFERTGETRTADTRSAATTLGPWCWSVHSAGAPEMAVGIAPAVTLRGGTVALWALTSENVPPSAHRAALGAEAMASWHAAVLALPRSLPVLWRDLRELAQQPPVPVHLCSHLAEPGIERRDRVVDGGSFGLAFLLQLASRVLSLPLPPDVIASVAIDELGRTSRVDGLYEKLEGIATKKGWRLPHDNPQRASTLPAAGDTRTAANFIVGQIAAHEATIAQFRAQLDGKGDAEVKRALREALPGYQENLQLLLALEF